MFGMSWVSWLLRHAVDDFLAHQHNILVGPANTEVMTTRGLRVLPSRMDMRRVEAELAADDQLADVYGTMARGLVAKRHTRLFYLTSAYPSQSIKRMLGLEHAQATRKQFLVDDVARVHHSVPCAERVFDGIVVSKPHSYHAVLTAPIWAREP